MASRSLIDSKRLFLRQRTRPPWAARPAGPPRCHPGFREGDLTASRGSAEVRPERYVNYTQPHIQTVHLLRARHYLRDNNAPSLPWYKGALFGGGATGDPALVEVPVSSSQRDLLVVVRCGDELQSYRCSGSSGQWAHDNTPYTIMSIGGDLAYPPVTRRESYQRIVGLGQAALPSILEQIEKGDFLLNRAALEIARVSIKELVDREGAKPAAKRAAPFRAAIPPYLSEQEKSLLILASLKRAGGR